MAPSQRAIEVFVADDAEVRRAVDQAALDAGTTLEGLMDQARSGHFNSERARRAWFAVSSLIASPA
jgi:hypothetical protein